MTPEYDVTPYIYRIDDVGTTVHNYNYSYNNGPTQSIPMGWYPAKLTPEEKIEKAKEVKVQKVKDVKRHVLGPKRSRWG